MNRRKITVDANRKKGLQVSNNEKSFFYFMKWKELRDGKIVMEEKKGWSVKCKNSTKSQSRKKRDTSSKLLLYYLSPLSPPLNYLTSSSFYSLLTLKHNSTAIYCSSDVSIVIILSVSSFQLFHIETTIPNSNGYKLAVKKKRRSGKNICAFHLILELPFSLFLLIHHIFFTFFSFAVS